VETCFPIEDKRMKRKVLEEGLLNYLSDNTQSWILQNDGSYKQTTPGNNKARAAQAILLEQYAS
jgi:polyphosphate kinase